jgi:hypothetical protein
MPNLKSVTLTQFYNRASFCPAVRYTSRQVGDGKKSSGYYEGNSKWKVKSFERTGRLQGKL